MYLYFTRMPFQGNCTIPCQFLLLLALWLLPLAGSAQKLASTVVFYGEDEPLTVWMDGQRINETPQISVKLPNPPPGMHDISIYFADTSMRAIEHYPMSFPEGYTTSYKIKRKSIPYEKPKFFLQFFEQEPTAYVIRVKATGIPAGEPLKLYAIRGDEMPLLAEKSYSADLTFILPDTTSPGMLRLSYGQKEQLDFIFNKENMQFSFDRQNVVPSIQFEQGGENWIYFTHLRTSNAYLQKMYPIYQLLSTYSDKDDAFYQSAQAKFKQLHTQLDSIWYACDTLYHQTFANALLQRSRPYFPEPTADRQQYNRAIREHFFDALKFDEPRLIHSSLYANKMQEYLNLWFNNRLEQEEQNKLFQQGIDALLGNAQAGNEQVFSYTAQHLQALFKQISNDEMVFYIDNTWLSKSCEADELAKEKVTQRIEAYKRMQIGNVAPDFKAADINGKSQQLYAVKAPLKVLVFWASWCEHCQEEIPQLLPFYEQYKKQGVEFIAVSLDKDRAPWTQFVKEKQFNWINVSELKGFDSPIANAYYIFKTPSYLVLDQDNKILAKPRNPGELQEAIRNAVK